MYEEKTIIHGNSDEKDFESIYNSWYLSRPAEWDGHNKIQMESEKTRAQNKCDELKTKPKWEKLLRIEWIFNTITSGNALPYIFEKVIAPFFFDENPNGEIWFSKFDGFFTSHWQREKNLFNSLGLNHSTITMGSTPQAQTGLHVDEALPHVGMSIPFILNYPYIMGLNHYTMEGNFFFILDDPIHWIAAHEWNVSDMFAQRLYYIYNDDITPSAGPRRPVQFLEPKIFQRYLDWYIEHLGILNEYILNQSDDTLYFLYSYSISRIMVETYIVQYSYMPFTRTVNFFNLLDKYANLVVAGGSGQEGDVWKRMVDYSSYESLIRPLLELTDRTIGSRFADAGTGICEQVETTLTLYDTVPDSGAVLRAYRNTHHGYLLHSKQRKILLSNSGNISNHLPDYSVVLWHAFLQNPQGFVDALK